jgi:hypothetical protein
MRSGADQGLAVGAGAIAVGTVEGLVLGMAGAMPLGMAGAFEGAGIGELVPGGGSGFAVGAMSW